jgi:uncharacterized protein
MQPNILFKTKKENNYLYNFNMNRFFLIHPVMDYLLKLSRKGLDLEKWVDHLPDEGIEIEGHGTAGKEEILYYYQKYLLFSRNDFFLKVKHQEKFSGRVAKEQVYSLLSNVRQVVFEVTDMCNLKCKYCAFGEYYDNYDKRGKKKLSIVKAKTLLNYLGRYWHSPLNTSHHVEITLSFYGGEPLLNIDFIKEIVRYSKKLESPRNTFNFMMTTNALLLDRYMDFLVENNFGLLISLDGNKHHNGYRVLHDGTEAYDRVFQNVNLLKAKYPDFFKMKVNFNTVLHHKNSVSAVAKYFKENFHKTPTLSEISPIGIRHDKHEEFIKIYQNSYENLRLSKDYLTLEKELFARLPSIKALSTIVHNCSGHCYNDYRELLDPGRNVQRIPTGTCLPFSRKLFLSVNGKILPCERIGHQYYYGTVDEKKVHLDAEKVAQQANDYYDKIRSQCFHCYKVNICIVCIFNLDIDAVQKIKNCPDYMSYETFSKYLALWMSKLEENPGYYPKIMDEVYVS